MSPGKPKKDDHSSPSLGSDTAVRDGKDGFTETAFEVETLLVVIVVLTKNEIKGVAISINKRVIVFSFRNMKVTPTDIEELIPIG